MTTPLHETINLDRHAIVNASAGTGKTYTIQNLYVRLVRERGFDPAQILVLTFTEKATAELRQKIRAELVRARTGTTGSIDARVSSALLGFDGAQIFTIHGFCQRALTQFAFENSEPFHLAAADDTELYATALRDLLRNVWPQTFGDALPGLLSYAHFPDCDKWEERVIRLARQLRKRPAPADRLHPEAPTVNAVLDAQKKSKAIFARIAALSRLRLDGEAVAVQQFRRLIQIGALNRRQEISGESLLQSALRHAEQPGVDLLGAAQIFLNGERSADKFPQTNKGCDEALAACRELSEIAGQLRELARAANALSGAFTSLAAWNLSEAVERYKREEGTLSFDDMLTRLRDALDESLSPRTAPLLLKALRGRYHAAIVDEAQDTDRVQWDILQRLFAVDTRQHPQRLYAVGDPKQAIYAFRGADVEAYVRACAALKPQAGEHTLSANWRSTAPLIRALNRLFEADYFPAESPFSYTPISAVPDAKRTLSVADEAQAGAALVLYALNNSEFDEDGPEDSVPSDEIQDRVAHFVSSEIAALLAPGRTRLMLRERGIARELEPGDICILVRSKREALPLERALARSGIPHSHYKKEGLYESEEALELSYLFAAIARPGDNAALKRALLTSFFRLTPQQLAQAGELPAEHRARVLLTTWRQKAERRQWPALFRSILDDTTVLFSAENDTEGRAERRLMNLQHLAEELENAARRQHLDFVGIADHLQRCRFRSVTLEKDADLQRIESERSKVQLMTMHVSKGLEFPVVFIAGGLGNEPSNDTLTYHVDDTLVYDIQPDGAAKDLAQKERDAEARRLFYVALTRAQVKLYVPYLRDEVLTATGEPRKSRRPMVRLLGPRLALLASVRSPEVAVMSWRGRARPKSTEVEPATQQSRMLAAVVSLEEVLEGTLPSEYWHRRLVHRSYSALKQEQRAFGEASVAVTADEAGQPRLHLAPTDLPGGTEVGSLLHRLLEELDFQAIARLSSAQELARLPEFLRVLHGADPQRLVRAQPERVEEAATIVWHALRTPLEKSGFALGQLARSERLCEMEFTFPLPTRARGGFNAALLQRLNLREEHEAQGYLNGFIDLVYRRAENGAERYYVLDWKSDILEAYDAASIRAHMELMDYTLQYKVYALALQRWLSNVGRDPRAAFGGIQYIFLRGIGRAASDPQAGVLNVPLPDDLSAWELELYARLNERPWREGGL